MQQQTLIIPPALSGVRRDKALTELSEGFTRQRIQQLLSEGAVTCNGQPVLAPSGKVKAGETYLLIIPDTKPLALEPVSMPLDIVYEDAALLVINKPAGLTVHPGAGTKEPTLVHALLVHCGDSLSGIGGVARPGIVHRLDKDTSGLLLVAKTDAAHQHLSAQLKSRTLSREYAALCWGIPQPPYGTIDAAIARHPKDRLRMAVATTGGKAARTHYQTRTPYYLTVDRNLIPLAAHLQCKLESGRTHQIRVHCQHIGHALIGDPLYKNKNDNRLHKFCINELKETISFLTKSGQQALHACTIQFVHPENDTQMRFEAPLPERMQEILSRLKHLQNKEF